METTKENPGLLGKIIPPRLEDAGLEDCALPPDSIKEAFFKAACAVKSRATSIFTENEDSDDCVQDPWPEEAKDVSIAFQPVPGASDTVVGIETGKETPGPCVAEKGGRMVEEGKDKVIVGGDDVEEGEEENGGCLGDGFKKGKENGRGKEEEEEGEGKMPILTEGFV